MFESTLPKSGSFCRDFWADSVQRWGGETSRPATTDGEAACGLSMTPAMFLPLALQANNRQSPASKRRQRALLACCHHKQSARYSIGRQSSPRRGRRDRQSLDELSFLDCRNLRLPHRRRTELPRESYSDITNVNSIPPYLIANAAFGYEATHWGIDVNVHNITNERYFLAANAGVRSLASR
jgi:hypothetical protein